MEDDRIFLAVIVGGTLLAVLGTVLAVWIFYRRVGASEALLVSGLKDTRVFRRGGLVFPIIHRAETIDLSAKTLRFERRKLDAVLAKDVRVEIDLVVTIRVNDTNEDILKVATRIGPERSYDAKTLHELFAARVTSSLAFVAHQHTLDEIVSCRAMVEDRVIEHIGKDLDGFVLDTLAIERVEQVPAEYAFR